MTAQQRPHALAHQTRQMKQTTSREGEEVPARRHEHDNGNANDEVVVVIGGGIAGLSAAYELWKQVQEGAEADLRDAGRRQRRVIVLERNATVGGQIKTAQYRILTNFEDPPSTSTATGTSRSVPLEQGAEGFVYLSEAVLRIAREIGVGDDEMVEQAVLETGKYHGRRRRETACASSRSTIEVLQRGVAAKRLGFGVEKKHLGRGLRSFKKGMQFFVEKLEEFLLRTGRVEVRKSCPAMQIQVLTGAPASSHRGDEEAEQRDGLCEPAHLQVKCVEETIGCCRIVLACSLEAGRELLKTVCTAPDQSHLQKLFCDCEQAAARSGPPNSNVNVNLVVESQDGTAFANLLPDVSGLTFPELQTAGDEKELDEPEGVEVTVLRRLGFRACSFASKKFPAQFALAGAPACDQGHSSSRCDKDKEVTVVRFYFRPPADTSCTTSTAIASETECSCAPYEAAAVAFLKLLASQLREDAAPGGGAAASTPRSTTGCFDFLSCYGGAWCTSWRPLLHLLANPVPEAATFTKPYERTAAAGAAPAVASRSICSPEIRITPVSSYFWKAALPPAHSAETREKLTELLSCLETDLRISWVGAAVVGNGVEVACQSAVDTVGAHVV